MEEDLRRPLVEQLVEYQKFKMAAQHLKEKEENTSLYWARPAAFDAEANREELVEANLYDLVHAFALLIKRTGRRAELEIHADQFSVKQKIQELSEYLETREHFSLAEYTRPLQTRGEMIVLFLAILEMIRLNMMRIFQGETFGDILIYRLVVTEEED
jgi:segregation and condensation protein A